MLKKNSKKSGIFLDYSKTAIYEHYLHQPSLKGADMLQAKIKNT